LTTNDNDAPETICRFCGKPTTKSEFYMLPRSSRQWAHFECMVKAGRRAMASGKLHDVRMAIDWGDGTFDISAVGRR